MRYTVYVNARNKSLVPNLLMSGKLIFDRDYAVKVCKMNERTYPVSVTLSIGAELR